MRVLGPVILDRHDQRKMREHGHKHLIVKRAAVFEDAAEKARPGDRFWVKEPFFDVQSARFGSPEFHEMIIGYGPWRYEVPAHIKPYAHIARWRQVDAKGLRRGESMAFLEIVEPVEKPVPGWLCKVYLQNIDAALKAEAA